MTDTPISDNALAEDLPKFLANLAFRCHVSIESTDFTQFAALVREKLSRAKAIYGDASFGKPELFYDIEAIAECIDLVGWPFLKATSHPSSLSNCLAVAAKAFELYRLIKEDTLIKG